MPTYKLVIRYTARINPWEEKFRSANDEKAIEKGLQIIGDWLLEERHALRLIGPDKLDLSFVMWRYIHEGGRIGWESVSTPFDYAARLLTRILRSENIPAQSSPLGKLITESPEDLAVVNALCEYAIDQQKKGKRLPGHVPRSGIFADCSMACDPKCLAVQAQKLKKKLVS